MVHRFLIVVTSVLQYVGSRALSYARPKEPCLIREVWADEGRPQLWAALTRTFISTTGIWGRLRTADILPFPRRWPSDW